MNPPRIQPFSPSNPSNPFAVSAGQTSSYTLTGGIPPYKIALVSTGSTNTTYLFVDDMNGTSLATIRSQTGNPAPFNSIYSTANPLVLKYMGPSSSSITGSDYILVQDSHGVVALALITIN